MSKKRGSYLLIGAIVGFIIGLFFAPKKGTELRQDAKEKIDEIKDNPTDVLRGTVSDIKDKINKVIDDTSDIGNIEISEEEIVISRTFDKDGE